MLYFRRIPATFKNDRLGDPDDILHTMPDYFPRTPMIAVVGSGAIGSYYGGGGVCNRSVPQTADFQGYF